MKTKVVITVDVEPSIAGAFAKPYDYAPLFDEPVWGVIGDHSEALGFLIRTLEAHGLSATFFLETAHRSYFGDSPMEQVAQALHAAGQDIQLHLHPCWRRFETGEPLSDECAQLPGPLLNALLLEGMAAIDSWVGQRPSGFRTGNFSVAPGIYPVIADAGLKLTSNICRGVLPVDADFAPAAGVVYLNGVTEIPATSFVDPGPVGRNKWRPMQITACGAGEMQGLLNRAHSSGYAHVVVVTHPFEFLKYRDFRFRRLRPNRMVQSRLEKLCAFLVRNDDRFEVTTFGALAQKELPAQKAEPPIASTSVRSLVRTAANGLNDRF